MIHELKTEPEYFTALYCGLKNFEVRKDDRGFKIGDELLLKEFVPKGYYQEHFTGRILHRRIDYILKGGQFGIEESTVIMSLSCI